MNNLPANFGPWENLGILGKGGQSTIYRATRTGLDGKPMFAAIRTMQETPEPLDLHLNTAVARKHVSDKATNDAAFANEYRVLAKLRSIYIAPVLDFGLEPIPWMATKLIEGQNLASYLVSNGGQIYYETWVRFARQLIGGLQHAHKRKVVHQDIKPLNIMITKSKVAVWIDFSSASIIGVEDDGYQGSVLTPTYGAPERYVGTFSDKSDIFALGVTLYEAATGQRVPWSGLGKIDTQEKYNSFCKLVEAGPTTFPNMTAKQRSLIEAMMELNPALRPSAGDVLVALNQMMIDDFDGKRPTASSGNHKTTSEAKSNVSNQAQEKETNLGCLLLLTPLLGYVYLIYRELNKSQKPLSMRFIRRVGLWASIYSAAGFGGWLMSLIWYFKTGRWLFLISGIVQLASALVFYLYVFSGRNPEGAVAAAVVWGSVGGSLASVLSYTNQKG